MVIVQASENNSNHEKSPQYQLKYINEKIPSFKMIGVLNNQFSQLTNNDIFGNNNNNNSNKWCILYFYSSDFMNETGNELIELNNNFNNFCQLNCNIVGISTDSHFAHLAWIKTLALSNNNSILQFALLSDLTVDVSKRFDVLLNGSGQSMKCIFIVDNNQIVKFFTKLNNHKMNCKTFVKNLLQTIKNLQKKNHS